MDNLICNLIITVNCSKPQLSVPLGRKQYIPTKPSDFLYKYYLFFTIVQMKTKYNARPCHNLLLNIFT